MINLGNDWDTLLNDEFQKEYYQTLRKFLVEEYNSPEYPIYPPMHDIFNALKYTSYKDAKVVILGQDPYHGVGQAHGLCFSVKKGVNPPPSLINIFKEQESDVGITIPNHGELTTWATQGVLLLNTVLTVRGGQPNSHANKGWEILTDKIIELLNQKEEPLVFLLWGNNAKAKRKLLNNPKHLVLTAPHPSPLSAYHGWFGCKHFSKTNEYLIQNNLEPINWQLPK